MAALQDSVLGQVGVPPVSAGSGPTLGALLAAQRDAARDADFGSLTQTSLTLLGAGDGHGTAVRVVRSAVHFQAERAMALVDDLREGLSQLAARPDHAEQATGIRGVLAAWDPEVAARAEPLLQQVAAGAVDDAPFQGATDAADLLGNAPATALEASLCVAGVARGLLGLTHGVLGTLSPPPADLASFDEQLGDLRTNRDQMDAMLRQGELALFNACATGERAMVGAAAAALKAAVLDFVVPFASQHARAIELVAALRAAGRNGDAETAGAVLAQDGLVLRRAIADAAVATGISLDLSLRVPPPYLVELMATQGVAFDAVLPDGVNRDLGALSPGDEGVLVEVGGFVTSASASREPDGKLVGRVTIIDPSSGAQTDLSLLFAHPAHIGITVDAYVTAHGVYRESSARLAGGAGVEVDTLSPRALSEVSWQARLWFAAGRWIDVWRSNLHLSWSLGRHTAGLDDSEDMTRGAAELIYAPFARTEVA